MVILSMESARGRFVIPWRKVSAYMAAIRFQAEGRPNGVAGRTEVGNPSGKFQ
jgi:hypothetical protein